MLTLKSIFNLLLLLLLSPKLVAQNPASFDTYLDQVLQDHVIPGFSVVVVNQDKVIYSGGSGVERKGHAEPFTAESVSAIGSLTKSMTALAVMQLVEKGALDLDTPIKKFLPSFSTANQEKSDKITLRMLLNNTSGLQVNYQPTYDLTDKALEDLARSLKGSFLTREPGSAYEYSNLGFSLAGLIISQVSGMSYQAYLQQNIFKPLGMRHTSANPGDFGALGALEGHYPGVLKAIPAVREPGMESGEYIPAGSHTVSCAGDLGNYLITLLNGGKFENRVIISPESIQEMWRPQSAFPGLSEEQGGDGKPIHYGLGWMISPIEGRKVIHHGGSTGKMCSMTMISPENQVAVSLLANLDLTFIDQYQYPRVFTMVNNLLRLAEGKTVSDFGKPQVSDPSLNRFNLKSSAQEKYSGDFLQIKGGDHWVNFGLSMTITQGDSGLEAVLTRGHQMVNKFRLDFINPAQAISRNMAIPQPLKFKITPDGQVQGLYFAGMEFIRSQHMGDSYKTIILKENINFLLPRSWEVLQTDLGFYAHDKNNPRNQLWGHYSDANGNTDCADFKRSLTNAKLVTGPDHFQIQGQYAWKQASILTNKDGRQVIHTSFSLRNVENGLFLTFSTEQADHSLALQQVMMPLLRTLEVSARKEE